MGITKILVGTPSGPVPGRAIRAAAELATSHRAELVVLHLEPAVDPRQVFDPDGVPAPTPPALPLADDFPGLRVRARHARGGTVQALCQAAAEERPDLVVVPHARRRPAEGLSARASRSVAGRVDCPVVLVAS